MIGLNLLLTKITLLNKAGCHQFQLSYNPLTIVIQLSCGVYANLGFSQTKAEKCGIALSHYDIDGHLIFADEKTVLTFVELLQPPPKAKGQFDDVLAAFENEPINYRLNRLDLPPSAEYRYQLTDESNAILLEKYFQIYPHFLYLHFLLAIINYLFFRY